MNFLHCARIYSELIQGVKIAIYAELVNNFCRKKVLTHFRCALFTMVLKHPASLLQ